MSKSKVITLTIIGVLLAMSVLIGVSYSLWRISLVQETANTLTTSCFDITFTEDNNISLQNAYPLYDEDGKKLTPYTFTIQNNCEAYATYNIQLEVLSSSSLASEHLKIQINEEEPVILNTLETGEVTLSEADEAYILDTGTLNLSEEKTYTLRVWLDEDVTLETEGVQNTSWSAKITVNSNYTDRLVPLPEYCIQNPDTAACQLLAQGETNELKYDSTVDQNLRYVGADPDNYVYFNVYPDGTVINKWEEIGLEVSSVEECNQLVDSTFNCSIYEDLGFSSEEECNNQLPIILEENFNVSSPEEFKSTYCVSEDISGKPMLWRIIGVMNNIDNGTGNKETRLKIISSESIGRYSWDTDNMNDWTTSSLQEELNNTFLSSIPDPYQQMISAAVWNLGAAENPRLTTSTFYTYERGANVYEGRSTEWAGKIGLMYPSDYGYATSGGSTTNRATCLNTVLFNWNSSSVLDCRDNDWLKNADFIIPTLTPKAQDTSLIYCVYGSYGNITHTNANAEYSIFPSLYLSSNVKITAGTGTSEDPFILSL